MEPNRNGVVAPAVRFNPMSDDGRVRVAYDGGPSKALIKAIQRMTFTDASGRRFRRGMHGELRRLGSPESFAVLNGLIDRARKAVTNANSF